MWKIVIFKIYLHRPRVAAQATERSETDKNQFFICLLPLSCVLLTAKMIIRVQFVV